MAEQLQAESQRKEFASILKEGVIYSFTLKTLIISNCNGTGSYPFSRATVDCNVCPVSLKSVMWFYNGFKSVTQALRGNKTTVKDEKMLESFLDQIRELKHLECLRLMRKHEEKTETMVRNCLAAHYFHPLAYGSDCIVDVGSSDMCLFCKQTVRSGDTSLGYPTIWHGRTDIIIKNSVVKVALEPYDGDDDDDDDESGEPAVKAFKKEYSTYSSIIEVKCDKNDSYFTLEQALAEGIVNAFCEAKENISLSKKFIPSFFATDRFIRIIWYRVDKDILLLSDALRIWDESEGVIDTATLNTSTLLHVWLALNFDCFEMDVDKKMLEEIESSNFRKFVGEDVYSIYSEKVSKPMKPCEQIELKFKLSEMKDGHLKMVTMASKLDHLYHEELLDFFNQ